MLDSPDPDINVARILDDWRYIRRWVRLTVIPLCVVVPK